MDKIAFLFMVVLFAGFAYNLTEGWDKESRLLNACIFYNLELQECNLIYGGIPK